jgi:hypothetical protein
MAYDYLRAVEEIQRRYSPERIARSRARLAAVWNGHGSQPQTPPDAIPFIFTGVPNRIGANGGMLYEARYPRNELLAYHLEAILTRAAVDDDYIPSLFPGCRQGLIPTAYGAREEWTSDHYWLQPLLVSAEQVDDLKQPDFMRDGVAAEILENTRFFRRATEGRLPIQMPDMQGPLDLAGNMVGVEPLMTEMYDHPAAVHRLLDRMTRDFITYMHLQEEASGGTLVPIHCMPTVWLPPGRAMSLSEDLLAVISPRFYPAFARPYNERVAAEYGQVVIHSCGSWEHNLGRLAQTQGLLGVNFGVSETNPERVAVQFGPNVVLLMHHTTVTCNGLRHYSTAGYVDWVFDFIRRHNLRAIALLVPDEGMTTEDCAEVAQMAREKARLTS